MLHTLSKDELIQGIEGLADRENKLRLAWAHNHKCGTRALALSDNAWVCLWCNADFLNDTPEKIETKVSSMDTPVLQTN